MLLSTLAHLSPPSSLPSILDNSLSLLSDCLSSIADPLRQSSPSVPDQTRPHDSSVSSDMQLLTWTLLFVSQLLDIGHELDDSAAKNSFSWDFVLPSASTQTAAASNSNSGARQSRKGKRWKYTSKSKAPLHSMKPTVRGECMHSIACIIFFFFFVRFCRPCATTPVPRVMLCGLEDESPPNKQC